jgi:membrane protease YdiL (CAAX protease family)
MRPDRQNLAERQEGAGKRDGRSDAVDGAGDLTGSSDQLARDLRGFGPVGIAAFLVILLVVLIAGNPFVPLGAILVLIWARWSRTPLSEIGYARPVSWPLNLSIGISFGIALKFLMKAIIMPLLGADPVNHAFHYLAGKRAALPGAIWMMIVVAGFGEETVFRGYLFERLGKLFGATVRAKTLIVLLTAVLFGLGHYTNQGLAGVEQATIVGLVFGAIFARTNRICMLMFAHAAFDLTALTMIFLDVESDVAHLVFK